MITQLLLPEITLANTLGHWLMVRLKQKRTKLFLLNAVCIFTIFLLKLSVVWIRKTNRLKTLIQLPAGLRIHFLAPAKGFLAVCIQ